MTRLGEESCSTQTYQIMQNVQKQSEKHRLTQLVLHCYSNLTIANALSSDFNEQILEAVMKLTTLYPYLAKHIVHVHVHTVQVYIRMLKFYMALKIAVFLSFSNFHGIWGHCSSREPRFKVKTPHQANNIKCTKTIFWKIQIIFPIF